MAQRFDEFMPIRQVQTRTQAASGLRALGQKFERFGQMKMQEMQQQAIEEEQRAGRAAFVKGEKPRFKEEGGVIGGVSAKAYNKGLKHAYMASLSNDVRTDLERIERENPDDVEAYSAQVAANRAALVKEVDPVVLPDVLEKFDAYTTAGQIKIADAEARKNRANSVYEANQHIKTTADNLIINSRSGELEQAKQSLIEVREALESQVDADMISRAEAEDKFNNIKVAAATQGYVGDYERLFEEKGAEVAYKELSELPTKPPQGYSQPQWDAAKADIRQALNRKQSIANAFVQDTRKEAVGAFKEWSKANSLGMDIPAEETQRVAKLISPFPELTKQFDIIQSVKPFSVMSAKDRQTELVEMKGKGVDFADEYAAKMKANYDVQKAYFDDGLKMANDQGLIVLEPLRYDDDGASFQKRIEQSKLVQEHSGIPQKELRNAEIEDLAKNIETRTVDEKISIAKTFMKAPDKGVQLWSAIAGKGAGTFAVAGSTGDENIMTAVFEGQLAIKEGVVKPIKPDDYLLDWQNMTEGLYSPTDAKNNLNAVKAYLAYTSEDKTGLYDSDEFEDAVQAITGGIAEISGVKVELPRGVDEDQFQRYIDTIQPETVKDLGGVWGMTDNQAANLIQDAFFKNAADGYEVITSQGTLMQAGNPSQPFILKYSDDLYSENYIVSDIKVQAQKKVTDPTVLYAAGKIPFID